jgi:hypothetical protein
MKYLTKISWLLIAFALLTLAACSGGTSVTPTVDSAPVFTQIALTALAMQTETALAVPPTPTVTNTPEAELTPKVTNTPLITDTPLPGTPSVTPLVLNTPKATTQQACDNMEGVADVTYPDGTEVPAGASFTKTWRIKNLGPCTWNQGYSLQFGWGGGGTNWNTVQPVYLLDKVLPGETVDISVTLVAPTTSGEYVAAFRLQNDTGFNFGPAQTVDIKVK